MKKGEEADMSELASYKTELLLMHISRKDIKKDFRFLSA